MAAPIGACIALEVLSAEVVNSTSEMTIATEVKEMRPNDHCGLLHPEKQKRHFVEYIHLRLLNIKLVHTSFSLNFTQPVYLR